MFINGPISEYTPVNGKTINYMEEESSNGLMVVHTLETTMTTLKLAKGVTNGLMANLTMENGEMDSKTELVYSQIQKE